MQMSKYFKPTEKTEPVLYNINTTLTEIFNKESKDIKILVNRISKDNEYYCETLEFNVPLYEKREIRYDNMGHEAKNYLQGDIIIVIKVSEDKQLDYKLKNHSDIYTNRNVTISELFSRDIIKIPYFNNQFIQFRLCKEIINNNMIKIHNKGLWDYQTSENGHLFILFNVILPDINIKKQIVLRKIFKTQNCDNCDEICKYRDPIEEKIKITTVPVIYDC